MVYSNCHCVSAFYLPLIEILRISLIENESDKESKGDINISVVVIRIFCYGDWRSKWNSIA